MKLKFVGDEVVANAVRRGRGTKFNWAGIVEELYANPNKWVQLEKTVPYTSSAYYAKKFAGIEVVCTGGNHLPPDDPKKREWTVFMRFVPDTPVDEELF